MKDLYFQHTFADGRVMTIAVRRGGGLPEVVCTPKFCATVDADILKEYLSWRNEIFASLCELLSETEMLAVIALGADTGAA